MTQESVPFIKDADQAKEYLDNWIREQGYDGEIVMSAGYGKRGNYYDFDLIKPYGVFMVFEDGTVEDNYGTLKKGD